MWLAGLEGSPWRWNLGANLQFWFAQPSRISISSNNILRPIHENDRTGWGKIAGSFHHFWDNKVWILLSRQSITSCISNIVCVKVEFFRESKSGREPIVFQPSGRRFPLYCAFRVPKPEKKYHPLHAAWWACFNHHVKVSLPHYSPNPHHFQKEKLPPVKNEPILNEKE